MAEVVLIGFLAPQNIPDKRISKGDRCVKLAKVKEGPAGGQVRMAWNQVTAGFDAVFEDEPAGANEWDRYASAGSDDWGTWDNERS